MIDLQELRKNPNAFQEACKKKNIKFDVSEFLKVDEQYRTMKVALEQLRSEQNQFNKEIPKLQGAEKAEKLSAMKAIADKVKADTIILREVEENWNKAQLILPSIPLDTVPVGKDDSENVEIRTWGTKPVSAPLSHIELGTKFGLIDLERGVKLAGARNYFLIGDGARLQHAVMTFAMDFIHRKGFKIMDVPHIVKYEAMMGTSYFPGGEESAYHLDERDQDAYLIGTAEVSVTSFHKDEILEEKDLPIRYAGYSPCYRREAGTYGKDTVGLYRVHQFQKVEQVILCRADVSESYERHHELLGNAEELMQLLNLPYRVVEVCTGDMGRGQVYKHDIEAWMPSRNSYGETHSCSTFYDFQARRLMTRYKDSEGKNKYCFTLNNTLVASPRVLIPLLENNQRVDGKISIPEALRPYMGGQEIIG